MELIIINEGGEVMKLSFGLFTFGITYFHFLIGLKTMIKLI